VAPICGLSGRTARDEGPHLIRLQPDLHQLRNKYFPHAVAPFLEQQLSSLSKLASCAKMTFFVSENFAAVLLTFDKTNV
jgi:hypothetical protein